MGRIDNSNNGETLYRVVKRSQPDTIKYNRYGKSVGVSSALFKDKNGVSVSRKMERTEEKTIGDLSNYFKERLKGLAKLFDSDVTNANAVLIPKPSEGDSYHAEIHKSSTEILLDDIQALQLADSCDLIFLDKNIKWTR